MTAIEETVQVAEQATYTRTVSAALSETRSKFALAEALALDIEPYGQDRVSAAFSAKVPLSERLTEARQAIIDAGGEPRSVESLRQYLMTGRWARVENSTQFEWAPGVAFSPHMKAAAVSMSRAEFMQNPKSPYASITAPSTAVEAWSPDQRIAAAKELLKDPEVVAATVQSVSAPAPAGPVAQNAAMFTSASPEWYTPPAVVERTIRLLGAVDLDPCSNSHESPNVPAQVVYTAEDDGLAHEWHGRVYLNPPYGGGIDRWIEKLVDAHRAGTVGEAVALLPARTDTAWFRRLRDWPRCFVDGRLKFSGHENSAPFPSVVVYLGERLDDFVDVFGDMGDIYERVNPT